MEDIMECQTIERAESIWKIIESLTDTITNPDIFPKGIYSVLFIPYSNYITYKILYLNVLCYRQAYSTSYVQFFIT